MPATLKPGDWATRGGRAHVVHEVLAVEVVFECGDRGRRAGTWRLEAPKPRSFPVCFPCSIHNKPSKKR